MVGLQPSVSILKLHSYIAQYLILRTAQNAFTLYFRGRPIKSNTISTSLGSIQPYATINVRRLLVHISIVRYSFIQLNELEQCRLKTLAEDFNTTAQDLNLGSLSQESEAPPLRHCTLHILWDIISGDHNK